MESTILKGSSDPESFIYQLQKLSNFWFPKVADDTILMAEGEEELKSLLTKMKEKSEKVDLKLNIQKIKSMESSPITSWQIDGEILETVWDFIFGGLQNHCRLWLQPWS